MIRILVVSVVSTLILGGMACGPIEDSVDELSESFSGTLTVSDRTVPTLFASNGASVQLSSGPADLTNQVTRTYSFEDSRSTYADATITLEVQGLPIVFGFPDGSNPRGDQTTFVDAETTGQGVPILLTTVDTVLDTDYRNREESCRLVACENDAERSCDGYRRIEVRRDLTQRTLLLEIGTAASMAGAFEAAAAFEATRVFTDETTTYRGPCH